MIVRLITLLMACFFMASCGSSVEYATTNDLEELKRHALLCTELLPSYISRLDDCFENATGLPEEEQRRNCLLACRYETSCRQLERPACERVIGGLQQ